MLENYCGLSFHQRSLRMGGKPAMKSVVTTLLGLAMLTILPINGQEWVCPWCIANLQDKLVNCLYLGMVLACNNVPIQTMDDVKWTLLSNSDSMTGMPYDMKKEKMDDFFAGVLAKFIQQNYPNDSFMLGKVADLGGKCYSSVTGYDQRLVSSQIRDKVNDKIAESSIPPEGSPNPGQNSGMPYAANQNQQNFQPPWTPNQPPGNPSNSFDNPFLPKTTNNFPQQEQSPVNDNRYGNNPAFQTNRPLENDPFNSPVAAPQSSFNNPQTVNRGSYNSPVSPPINFFTNPRPVNNAPLNLPESPKRNSNSNSPPVNNDSGPSQNRPSSFNPTNDNKGQGQAGPDLPKNQAPSGGSPKQNNNQPQSNRNSQNNAPPPTTASPKTTSSSQDSKSSNSDIDDSNGTTPTPNTDASETKTTGSNESDDEEPCDEKFKITLYDKLLKDGRFISYFGKLPISTTKPAVPRAIKHAFKEYGIEKHYSEFSTLWMFESKELNRRSTAEDFAEIISKLLKEVLSRNGLLEENCEEIGVEIADYILDTLPGDPPASSTMKPNQNDGNDEISAESNSTTNASPENDSNLEKSNFTNPGNLSFHELNSKLANMFNDGTSDQDSSDDISLSKTLSTFEMKDNLDILIKAAKSCISSDGFDFKKYMQTIASVTDSIQNNHPDWSRTMCEKEALSTTVVALAHVLQDEITSSSSNGQSESSPSQNDSDITSDESQSSDSGATSYEPKDYDLFSDDSPYPGPGTDYDSDRGPPNIPYQQNNMNYDDYTEPANVPPYGNQPGGGDWNTGFMQPSDYDSGPVGTDYGDFQNAPFPANQPYQSGFNYNDYGPLISQPSNQNVPSQPYPAYPPASMNPQPYSDNRPYPVNPNTDFQQSPNYTPNARPVNAGPALPNGDFQNSQTPFQNFDAPAERPMIPNGNYQSQFNSNSQRGPDYRSAFPQDNFRNRQSQF